VRFSHEYVTPMAAIFFEQLVDGRAGYRSRFGAAVPGPPHVPERRDDAGADQGRAARRGAAAREEATRVRGAAGHQLYGELRRGHHGSEAICHSKILEAHAEPGQIIIGSDSHTPHAGAVGVAFGVGTTAISIRDHQGRAAKVPKRCASWCAARNPTT